MKQVILFLTCILLSTTAFSQVGIGTVNPDASAVLDITSTTQGLLPPRMTAAQREAIATPAQGLMMYCTNCGTNGEAQIYNGTAWVNLVGGVAAAVPTQVGDLRDGGIVFYVASTPIDLNGDGTLNIGLIAAAADLSNAQWGCEGTSISGADGTAIGTGNQNTIDIIAGCSTAGIAARLSAELTLNGYTDWFLPSKDELNLMYQNIGPGNALELGNIGSFASAFYWSSTENDNYNAWRQIFSNGYQVANWKSNTIRVRAVRAF